eukprot:XP_020397219.1 atherin-like [Zea mays]
MPSEPPRCSPHPPEPLPPVPDATGVRLDPAGARFIGSSSGKRASVSLPPPRAHSPVAAPPAVDGRRPVLRPVLRPPPRASPRAPAAAAAPFAGRRRPVLRPPAPCARRRPAPHAR